MILNGSSLVCENEDGERFTWYHYISLSDNCKMSLRKLMYYIQKDAKSKSISNKSKKFCYKLGTNMIYGGNNERCS